MTSPYRTPTRKPEKKELKRFNRLFWCLLGIWLIVIVGTAFIPFMLGPIRISAILSGVCTWICLRYWRRAHEKEEEQWHL